MRAPYAEGGRLAVASDEGVKALELWSRVPSVAFPHITCELAFSGQSSSVCVRPHTAAHGTRFGLNVYVRPRIGRLRPLARDLCAGAHLSDG